MTWPMKIFHDQYFMIKHQQSMDPDEDWTRNPVDQRSESLQITLWVQQCWLFDVYVPVNSYDLVNDIEAVSSLHCNHTFFPGQAWL